MGTHIFLVKVGTHFKLVFIVKQKIVGVHMYVHLAPIGPEIKESAHLVCTLIFFPRFTFIHLYVLSYVFFFSP